MEQEEEEEVADVLRELDQVLKVGLGWGCLDGGVIADGRRLYVRITAAKAHRTEAWQRSID